MNSHEIIRGAIPDAEDDLCRHILWGRTAFPFKTTTARELYMAASRFRRAAEKGRELCDMCDREVQPDSRRSYMCRSCSDALSAVGRCNPRASQPKPAQNEGHDA